MDPLKVIIREVQLQDAGVLQAFSIETFIDTYGAANTAENMKKYLAENFNLLRIAEELIDPHSKTFFSILDNEPVGYIKLNLQKGILDTIEKNGMEIARIYVRKKFQGKQVGKLLFNTAVDVANKYKHNYIWLGVWEKNPNAISFYEKMGLHIVGKHLFKLGEDLQRDVIMRFDL